MIPRSMVAALCLLGPLTCTAHGGNINGEATYISFSVPGALGTYPMSINASMTVTGYYYVSPTVARGFLRDADGTITTFNVGGSSLDRAGEHQCCRGYCRLLPVAGRGSARLSQARRWAHHHLPSAPAGNILAPTACRPYGSTARKHQRL